MFPDLLSCCCILKNNELLRHVSPIVFKFIFQNNLLKCPIFKNNKKHFQFLFYSYSQKLEKQVLSKIKTKSQNKQRLQKTRFKKRYQTNLK